VAAEFVDLEVAKNVNVEAKPTVEVTVEEEVEIYGGGGEGGEDASGAAAVPSSGPTNVATSSGWQHVAETQPQVREFRIARDFSFAPQPTDVLIPRFAATGASPMTGGSEATLKLEGEYWGLKADGLKKKAAALELKASEAKAVMDSGTGAAKFSDILDLESEQQLTLAEVKLCEMNAQRVRESIEAQSAAKDELGAKGNVRFEVEKIQDLAKVAEMQALKAQHEAMKAAVEAKVAATIKADKAVRIERKPREPHPPKKALPAMEVRPGVIHFKATSDSPDVVLTAPPAPAPPLSAKFVPQLSSNGEEFSVVPKEELKKLLSASEKMEKLQQRIGELEKQLEGPMPDEVKK
jgi:hypothetical protein